jgi:hypothetical protein
MKDAQRRRDAALRRLRFANRGGLVASVFGAVMVMALAHQATPVGKPRRVATQIIRRTATRPSAAPRQFRPGKAAVKHRITPAAAPTTVTTTEQSTPTTETPAVQPTPTTATPAVQSTPTTATPAVQSTPTTDTPTPQSTPTTAAAPVTSGGS